MLQQSKLTRMSDGPQYNPSSDDGDIVDARNEQNEDLWDGLSKHVQRCIQDAIDHKANKGVQKDIDYCLRAYKSKYTAEELEKFQELDAYRGITNMLVATAVSWLEDAYSAVDEDPWHIKATPRPNLPKVQLDALKQAVEIKLEELSANGQLSSKSAHDVVRSMAESMLDMASIDANLSAENMTSLINDQMMEAGWRDVFADYRANLCIYPTAVLKGPLFEPVRKMVWKDDEYVETVEDSVRVYNLNPADVLPSPDSKDTQTGIFVADRMRLTRSALSQARSMDGFSKRAIDLILYDYPQGFVDSESENSIEEHLVAVDPDYAGMFIVYDYYGQVGGDKLLEFLTMEGESHEAKMDRGTVDTSLGEIDPNDTYEINVWLCGGFVIRAVMDPYPLGKRPYHSASYREVPDSFWGLSIPLLAQSSQAEVNAAVRSRIFNMGIASGPTVEIDVTRFEGTDRPEVIEPWRIYYTEGSTASSQSPAVRFVQAASNAAELTQVAEEVWQKAHDLVGLPPHTRGSNEGAPRTLGAFSMQFSSATKGIKKVLSNIDRGTIEPFITMVYYHNMVNSDDKTIKGDAQISARGVIGLLRLEGEDAKPMETLTAIGPYAQSYPQLVNMLIAEFIKKRGYKPEQFGMASDQLVSQSNLSNQSLEQPPVDGRSGGAQQAIDDTTIQGPEK